MPVRASNLTMQCTEIQVNHHHVGLWTGHDFHPQFPSFASCSKVCAGASETKRALVCLMVVAENGIHFYKGYQYLVCCPKFTLLP